MIKKESKKYLKSINYKNITNWFKFLTIIGIVGTVIISSITFMYKHDWYQQFLIYTGLNTGYGFFSPNVASDFVITHKLYSQGKEDLIFSNSMFKTKEGAMRFTNINSLYMDKIEAIENGSIQLDSMRSKYLDLILNRMNTEKLKKSEIDSVSTTLFLYHFPFMKEYPNVKPKFIKIENHTKTRKNI